MVPPRRDSSDPDDIRLLEAAGAAGAACILSGDEHPLYLIEWEDVPVLRPGEFVHGYLGKSPTPWEGSMTAPSGQDCLQSLWDQSLQAP